VGEQRLHFVEMASDTSDTDPLGFTPVDPLALKLMDTHCPRLDCETAERIARAATNIVRLYAADPERDPDRVDLAMTRVVMCQFPNVDRAVVEWLTDNPSASALAVVLQMLWHLWTTAAPHPPIDPRLVRDLIDMWAHSKESEKEDAPFLALLRMVAAQVDDTALVTRIGQIQAEAQRLLRSTPP
jgi:hypothetical protein